jgi:adenylate cyclase
MDPVSQAAVLFADVSGSTRLYETAGDTIAAAAIDQCLTSLRRVTESAGGRVIKTLGDEIMSVFGSADAAAIAAIDMQGSVGRLPPTAGSRIGIKIGFNFGPVVERYDDVFGDAVNVAARLTSLARKDQVITSRETAEALSPVFRNTCRQLYSVQVKGREQTVELCELMWQPDQAETTQMMGITRPNQPHNGALRLRYRDQEIVLDATRGPLMLGRDKSAELCINDVKASRAHCQIERRMNKFVLVDHSTNGTFVTVEGDGEVVLMREEFTLRGRGWIAFGQSRTGAQDVVEFSCEGPDSPGA